MRKIGGIALILLVTGRGFARTPSSPADKVAEPVSKTVRGRVLLPDGTSIGGLMVSIGKQGTPTDSNGRFELPNVPETYDLMIAGQGGRFITAYFGLTRRDPIVTHTALGKAPLAKAEHRADIEGIVDMSAMASIRQATEPVAYFLSPSAVAKAAITEFREVYGRYRFSVGWGGPAVASGILLVLAQGGGQAYLASRRLTIADGQDIHPKFSETEVRADLKLAPVAMGRIAGSTQTLTRKIRLMRSEVEEREALGAAYAVPGMAGVVDLGECEIKQEGYVCQAPDLGVLGGQYCIAIVGRADTKLGDYAPGPTRTMDLRASRCGAKLGKTDFQMYRPSPPDIGKGQFNLGPDAKYWTRGPDWVPIGCVRGLAWHTMGSRAPIVPSLACRARGFADQRRRI